MLKPLFAVLSATIWTTFANAGFSVKVQTLQDVSAYMDTRDAQTIGDLKNLIANCPTLGAPVASDQVLVFKEDVMENDQYLSHLHLTHDDFFVLVEIGAAAEQNEETDAGEINGVTTKDNGAGVRSSRGRHEEKEEYEEVEFVESRRDGDKWRGTVKWKSGAKWVGAWKDNKMVGHGTWTGADGSVYTGNLIDGKQDWINWEGFLGAAAAAAIWTRLDADSTSISPPPIRSPRLSETDADSTSTAASAGL